MQEWWFLSSAPPLLLIDIYIRFGEDSMNSLEVTEQTQFCDGQSSKGNNSNSISARVMVLVLCMSYNIV